MRASSVKWFVAEPLYNEARRLLARRIDLYAPDLVLSEFANTIWKKTRRKEIPDQEPYLNELSSLSDVISLLPDRELIERAARMAFAIDHPVYDCLYLACAEATGSGVITADRRLANKSAAQHFRGACRIFGGCRCCEATGNGGVRTRD